MKKLLVLFPLLFLLHGSSIAGVSCSLPFNLQNNTTADANQVMANYNAIVTCLGNAAHAGSNSDITALNALATPIPPSSGGTFTFIGSASGGSANAQTTSTTPTGFALTSGYRVGFVAGATNTAAVTLNVNATGVKNVFRRTTQGLVTTVGGELVSGNYVEVVYDGTQYQIMGPTENPGAVVDWAGAAGASAPPGWAFADGSCLSRTTYATLFAVTSTTYEAGGVACTGSEFAVPDLRGRMTLAKDNQGATGTAGRVTNAESGCTGTTLGGAGCGVQSATLTQANLPNVTLGAGTLSILGGPAVQGSQTNSAVSASSSGYSNTVNGSTASINGGVTQTTHAQLNPALVVYKIIKL